MRNKIVLDESAITIVSNIVADSEPNLQPDNIRKGVDILGVVGTYEGGEPGPTPGTLVPFVDGQGYGGFVIDPTSNFDMVSYLNSLPALQEEKGDLLKFSDQSGIGVYYCEDLDGVALGTRAVVFVNFIDSENSVEGIYTPIELDLTVPAESGTMQVHVPAGWSTIDFSTFQFVSLTEKLDLVFSSGSGPFTLTAELVADFAPLNGTVFGAIEPEPKLLQEFEYNQTLTGVQINPAALLGENEDYAPLIEVLDRFISEGSGSGTSEYNVINFSDPVVLCQIKGYVGNASMILGKGDASNSFIFVPVETQGMVPGWYKVDQEHGPVRILPDAGIQSLEIPTCTVENESDALAFINGIVIGAITE